MRRNLITPLLEYIDRKVILLSGPRQVGKTTLSKQLSSSFEYLNFDHLADRKKIQKEEWDRSKSILILDELHKMRSWKSWLKGLYDTRKNQRIVVTGSTQLETLKKVGDSMAGRYFHYHLMPLDLKELKYARFGNPVSNFDRLMKFSGFPEPFLEGSEKFYRLWQGSHLDAILKNDIFEIDPIKRIKDLAFLVELLTERAASLFSYHSIREDLQTDDKSVKRWMNILENSYVLFAITPYSRSIPRGLKKTPKYYFYDFPRVKSEGAKLENFVALTLRKEILFKNDTEGTSYSLHYLQDRNGHEIDFLICRKNLPELLIEVKNGDAEVSKNFKIFWPKLKKLNPRCRAVQLVHRLERRFSNADGVEVENLVEWLTQLDLASPS